MMLSFFSWCIGTPGVLHMEGMRSLMIFMIRVVDVGFSNSFKNMRVPYTIPNYCSNLQDIQCAHKSCKDISERYVNFKIYWAFLLMKAKQFVNQVRTGTQLRLPLELPYIYIVSCVERPHRKIWSSSSLMVLHPFHELGFLYTLNTDQGTSKLSCSVAVPMPTAAGSI